MKYYLLIISNLFMLNIAQLFLKLGIQSIPNIIIKQCNKNCDFIERECL